MPARKGRIERQEGLAAYLEEHKDEDEWEDAELKRPTKVSSVYSIRFTAQELDALQAVAVRQGKRISQIVREAVSHYLAKQRERDEYRVIDFKRAQYISFTTSVETTAAVNPPLSYTWGDQPEMLTA